MKKKCMIPDVPMIQFQNMHDISNGRKIIIIIIVIIAPFNQNEKKSKQKILCKLMKARRKVGHGRRVLLVVSALIKGI